MVAAVLDLHIGARLGAEAFDQMASGLAHRHDVVDRDLLAVFDTKPSEGRALRLLLIADDVVDLVHRGEAVWIDLRRAAGHHDLGVGAHPARLPDRLPRLAHGFSRHRAGVDDHRVAQTGGVGMLAHDLRTRRRSAGSRR